MNYLYALIGLFLLGSCNSTTQKELPATQEDQPLEISESFEQVLPFDTVFPSQDIEFEQTKSVEIKRKQLIDKEDDQLELQELVIHKSFKKEADLYLIDFSYPYLNESFHPAYRNFNKYLEKTYLDIEQVEAQILEDKELICDTLRINRFKEKRLVDYQGV